MLIELADFDHYIAAMWIATGGLFAVIGLRQVDKHVWTSLTALGGIVLLALGTFWFLPLSNRLQSAVVLARAACPARVVCPEPLPHVVENPKLPGLVAKAVQETALSRKHLQQQSDGRLIGDFAPREPGGTTEEGQEHVIEFVRQLRSLRIETPEIDELLGIARAASGEKRISVEILSLSDKMAELRQRLIPRPAPTELDGVWKAPAARRAGELQDLLRAGVQRDFYAIELLPEGEVVEGQHGAYYRVTLRAGEDQAALNFQSGSFLLNATEQRQVERAAIALATELIDEIPRGIVIKIYLRGNSTAASWEGNAADRRDFTPIRLLHQLPNRRYKPSIEDYSVKDPPTNEDLPNMRAEHVRRVLELQNRLGQIGLLQGFPDNKRPAKVNRNVEIILFVKWS